MQGIILTLIYFMAWIQHTSCNVPQSLRECNLTKDDSFIVQLKGVLFTRVEPNGTQYYFSICGLKLPANETISGPASPMLVRKKPESMQWESLASVDPNTNRLIRKSGRSYLKVSQGASCNSLISMQCGLTVNMLIVLDEETDPATQSPCCLRMLEVYHPSLCSPVLRPGVWGIILGCTVVLLLLYCVLGLIYQKAIRKRSWHDSIPHVTVLDRMGARFANGLKHLRPRRVVYRPMQYIRVPVKDDSTPTTPPNEPKEATPFVRSRPLVHEEDPQDDLLLSL